MPAEPSGTYPGTDWSDLTRRGYITIPQFLSAEQCAQLSTKYATLPPATDSIGLGVRWMELPPDVMSQIRDVLRQVAQHTSIPVDAECPHLINSMQVPPRGPDEALVYATKQSAQDNKFPWHTDHGSYYKVQSHEQQLNFYIPIQKSDPNRSGLALIPADVLAAKDPRFAAANPGGASVFFGCEKGSRVPYLCYADCRDRVYPMQFDLDETAVCPALKAGDLLLLHMPIIHRTQDNETPRIALSYRVCYPAGPMERRNAFPICWHHFKSEEARPHEMLFSWMWYALWPSRLPLSRKATFLADPDAAWRECGLGSKLLLLAWSPMFAASMAFKIGRRYLKRAISRKFAFGPLVKEQQIGKRIPNRAWWRFFPLYSVLCDAIG